LAGVKVSSRQIQAWRATSGGWFLLDKVIGKHELISYAIGINVDGSVKQVEVLDYRESYGYEVRSPAWRGQFVGKKNAPSLTEEIRNISGATLSCRHLTEGVKRLLATYATALK
jgi:Na+-translocating ferredoxin:NAD+ oxidoreductase RnfG subunit